MSVFISYQDNDRHIVDRLAGTLEAAGVRVWIAARDIPPGADWPDEITSAIDNASAFVLVFSRYADASVHVKNEISAATDRKVPLHWIRIEDVKPRRLQYFLATRQGIDWIDQRDDEPVKRLARQLKSDDATSAAPPPPLSYPPGVRQRALTLATGLVAATAVGFAGWSLPTDWGWTFQSMYRSTRFSLWGPSAPNAWIGTAVAVTFFLGVWLTQRHPPRHRRVGRSREYHSLISKISVASIIADRWRYPTATIVAITAGFTLLNFPSISIWLLERATNRVLPGLSWSHANWSILQWAVPTVLVALPLAAAWLTVVSSKAQSNVRKVTLIGGLVVCIILAIGLFRTSAEATTVPSAVKCTEPARLYPVHPITASVCVETMDNWENITLQGSDGFIGDWEWPGEAGWPDGKVNAQSAVAFRSKTEPCVTVYLKTTFNRGTGNIAEQVPLRMISGKDEPIGAAQEFSHRTSAGYEQRVRYGRHIYEVFTSQPFNSSNGLSAIVLYEPVIPNGDRMPNRIGGTSAAAYRVLRDCAATELDDDRADSAGLLASMQFADTGCLDPADFIVDPPAADKAAEWRDICVGTKTGLRATSHTGGVTTGAVATARGTITFDGDQRDVVVDIRNDTQHVPNSRNYNEDGWTVTDLPNQDDGTPMTRYDKNFDDAKGALRLTIWFFGGVPPGQENTITGVLSSVERR